MTGPKIIAYVTEEFGITLNELADLLLVGERTMRRWAAGDLPLPPTVELMLHLLADDSLSYDVLASESEAVREIRKARGEPAPEVPLERKERKQAKRARNR